MALQPLCDLLVAFSNDLPQEFYKRHFYHFLSKLISHLSTKEPEQIESVFLCIVSLFVVLQKYLREDLFTLYHVNNFSALLSKSYPWYVNELAAQSLGVLVRKIPKKDGFIAMSLKKLKKDESQVEGLGRVFASMIKSDVIQRLHSCTPKILRKLLEILKGDEVPQELALSTVKYTTTLVARYITTPHPDKGVEWQTLWKEDSALVWPTLWECIKDLLSQNNAEANQHLNCILQVIKVFVTHKKGKLITDVDDFARNCLAVLKSTLPDAIGQTMTEILSTILILPQDTLSSSVVEEIISAFLSSCYSPSTKFNFLKQLFDIERFDSEILPLVLPCLDELLGSSEDLDLRKGVIEFIATVTVQKQPPCTSGMDLSTWKVYPLDFSKDGITKMGHIGSFIESRIKEGILDDFSNLEDLSMYLICLPHIMHLDHQDLAPYLTWILSDALTSLKDEAQKVVESDKPSAPKKRKSDVVSPPVAIDLNIKSSIPLKTRRILFLMGLLVEVMSHILSNEDFLSSLSQFELVELMKRKHHYRENFHILRAVDIHFTILSLENQNVLDEKYLQEIYSFLAPSLSSVNPQVRFLVLHIFSLFSMTLPPPPENVDSVENVFEIMLNAESVPITPLELRDRFRYITMVDADHVKPHLPTSRIYDQAPLLFLIGQLYTNYKDLWEPILKAISGYAHAMPIDTFWPVWFSKLKIASHLTHEVLLRKQVDPDIDLHLSCSLLAYVNDSLSQHPGYSKITPKPDHLNFRDLLWRAMEKFPDICEAKNRDLVPLFFDFIEKEFFPVDFTVSPTQDIRAKSGQGTIEPESSLQPVDENMDIDVDDKLVEEIDDDEESPDYPKRASVKSLCEQLRLFSRFHNPKMLTQTKKLETMYKEFLTHPSPTLQKSSFDCLMTYNHPFLTPYKEHMYKLLEDKSFKIALTHFSIDGSDKILEDDHRKDFMPYLMRILYGKMHFKTGSNTSGKNKTSMRKAVIVRFLAGAGEEEFQTFIELAFDVLLGHTDGTALEVVERSKKNFDLQNVVPLKRLQGALTTMENILERIANKMTVKKSLLLKIILYITNVSTLSLERRDEVRKRHVTFLKHIRQRAQKLIVSFFSLIEDYSWQPEEIEAVFEVMVWPNLERLPGESLLSPTPLLRLLECWAEIPRYFPLLAKVHNANGTLTPLTYVTKLVASEKCNWKVTVFVFDMMEKLLTLKDHDETALDEEGKSLPLVVCPPTVEVTRLNSRDGSTQQNYGSALLVPHLEGLLQSMKILLSNLKRGVTVSRRDLTILSSLTEWVGDKVISEDLLGLIVPLIVNKHVKGDEMISELLTTCSYLLPIIDNSKKFLRSTITLFGCVEGRTSREALCQTLAAISSVNPELQVLADLAADLNAWNLKVVDEPDFERRLRGYKQMGDYCKSEEVICLDYCQFIVYSNMYVIRHVDDVSLRDMSRLCLDQLIDMCVRLQPAYPSEVKNILIDRLLSQVKTQLKHKKEEVRQDSFFLLQKIVHKCHSFYEKLEDLYKLADEAEEEGDFYSNMMHIQRHRRSRALMRLADKVKNGILCLTTETIMDYLMPTVKVHLFNDVYAKDDHLMQSLVRCLGAFATVLPWYPYLRLLKTYIASLAKEDLKYHKLGVRILEAVIDGFHEEVEEVKVYEGGSIAAKMASNSVVMKNDAKVPANETITGKVDKESAPEGKVSEQSTEVSVENDMKEMELADLPIAADDSLSKPQKVYLAVVNNIIPYLKRVLAARTKGDKKHKVNKSKFPEDEDIKRIPLAYALIKLMKKLPSKVLDSNVSSVLMKMITFLKCQSQSIRNEARVMLVKIMVELGGKYLQSLVSDMRSILVRGFQTHVLVFTLHSVLSKMRPVLCASHIDSCLVDMVEICKDDLLGFQDEEKSVSKITAKVSEAKNDKSYSVINFTAEFISAISLGDLIMPLKEVLAGTQNKKIVSKMVRCLTEITKGLEKNKNIELVQKSVFIYGLLNERLTRLTDSNKNMREDKKNEKTQLHDYRLLEPEPKKAKLVPKTTIETTSHLFIEFALRLFASLLRRGRFSPENKEHLKLLDPYVSVLVKCLSSEYPDISIYTLKCINFLVKFPLPALRTHIHDISSEMFVILHKFSSSELAKGKIFELVQLTFRSLAFIIKTVDYYVLNPQQVRVLLQYVQESLDDSSHQTTVFAVLQSVVARKIDVPELHQLMEVVKKMSVSSTRQYALNQARVTYYSYLLTYPMKKKAIINNIFDYLGNISYSIEGGRLSAQMFINGVVTNFPVKLFNKELETSLWLKLSEQIVKEECKENKLLLHKSLKTLFERSEKKSYLLDLCVKLLEDDNDEMVESHAVAVQLSCKSLSAFLDIPMKKMPQNTLAVVAPKIISLLNPSKFSAQVKGSASQNEDAMEGFVGREFQEIDNALVMLMEVLSKLVALYISGSGWDEHVGDDVWSNIQSLLFYPHIQVRLNAVGLIGQLLAACPVDNSKIPVLCSSTDKARSLVLDLCEVLRTQANREFATLTQLSLSVVRNLLYLIRNASRVSLTKNKADDDDDDLENEPELNEEKEDKERDPVVHGALWIVGRVGDIAYKELQFGGRECTVVREALLNFIAGVVVVVGDKLQTPVLLGYIIKHFARELSDRRLPEKLVSRTQEVANLVKDHIGVEVYTQYFTTAQVSLARKKLGRKVIEKQQKVVNPHKFRSKKKKRHIASAIAKKVAIAEKKGKVITKKKLAKLRESAIAME